MEKIVIIGSGNWASVIASIISKNSSQSVTMWVHEEAAPDGTPLSTFINQNHVNPLYLPSHLLNGVIAEPDLVKAVTGASLLVFVTPHQFLEKLMPSVRAGLSGGPGLRVKAISLIKGMECALADDGQQGGEATYLPAPQPRLLLPSDIIREGLRGANAGRNKCTCPTTLPVPAGDCPCSAAGCVCDDVDVCVLMGANVANEVVQGQFCEATVGYDGPLSCANSTCTCTATAHAQLWTSLMSTSSFRLSPSPDCATVELCGALKNVVALGAGFVDALGMGTNTKAAILRRGLLEMREFCTLYCAGMLGPVGNSRCSLPPPPCVDTFLESCGVADLVTTCFGGRNRRCAEEFGKVQLAAMASNNAIACSTMQALARADAVWASVEKVVLGGQKMQGLSTCRHVHTILSCAAPVDGKEIIGRFPLIRAIHAVSAGKMSPGDMLAAL